MNMNNIKLEIDKSSVIVVNSKQYGTYLVTKIAEINLLDALKDKTLSHTTEIYSKLRKKLGVLFTKTEKSEFIINQEIENLSIYTALGYNNKKSCPVVLSEKYIQRLFKQLSK